MTGCRLVDQLTATSCRGRSVETVRAECFGDKVRCALPTFVVETVEFIFLDRAAKVRLAV